MFRLIYIALIFSLVMGGLATMFRSARTLSAQSNAGGTIATSQNATVRHQRQRQGGTLELDRDETGQFRVSARIGGEDIRFLVDTGADVVALTPATAERLGIMPAQDQFRPIMRTASGTGYAAMITLDSLEIEGVEYHDIEAAVVQGLGTNLLGQSVLRQFGTVELQGDRMVIRPE